MHGQGTAKDLTMTQADIIKLAAVVTAAPRWIVALLAAEGLHLPPEWAGWWLPVSALSALGMAVVEGVAFAYVLAAWKAARQQRQVITLAVLAVVSAVLFIAMLTPSIAASVRGLTVGEWLANDAALTAWAATVAASTIAIVASVGYAERAQAQPAPSTPVAHPPEGGSVLARLAQAHGKSPRTIQRWIAAGKISAPVNGNGHSTGTAD